MKVIIQESLLFLLNKENYHCRYDIPVVLKNQTHFYGVNGVSVYLRYKEDVL